MPRKRRPPIEIYELPSSPFSQRPTQRDIGSLVGCTRDHLRFLATHKESFIVRRQEIIGKKQKLRDLKYPVADLRRVHERLKFHLNKIVQPSYLFSPRQKRSQRDNAEIHLNQQQYLTLDLKQFYPSTSAGMVHRWLQEKMGMYEDVAGLLTHLCTVDGFVSFGSPLTPVLCTLVHRKMFDEIADLCANNGLNYSVWVDDLTISGKFVHGDIVSEIRDIISRAGLKSHKIAYRTGNRPVFLTGIGVVGRNLIAPNILHLRIKELWASYHTAESYEEKNACIQSLLAQLGTQRYICGAKSVLGRKASDQMNSLRQKRSKMRREAIEQSISNRALRITKEVGLKEDAPFDLA
ncbi:reverse transcriptase family protein [Brucella thiophenivorans]|uniref:Reverse transcriptase family protein n=1 Tax=Brucella thiophenivorans TaxID=571255 RepID=A0A256FTT6_9HYPH|nr:reverse transcriptase family protein [Brucella thiophenivorans]OYR18277.1 reverse transcriptase family protein [Brucella thiophenivorans]